MNFMSIGYLAKVIIINFASSPTSAEMSPLNSIPCNYRSNASLEQVLQRSHLSTGYYKTIQTTGDEIVQWFQTWEPQVPEDLQR